MTPTIAIAFFIAGCVLGFTLCFSIEEKKRQKERKALIYSNELELNADLVRKIDNAYYKESKRRLVISFKDGGVHWYVGSTTVWRHFETMKRCTTLTESILSDIYAYIKTHGNPYPTAHRVNNSINQ